MSTRAVIARQTGPNYEFLGGYSHWDGYCSYLGRTLYRLIQQHGGEALAKLLIDAHPNGWSSVRDPIETGECYCHSRGEELGDESQLLTHETAQACGCEYAYLLGDDDSLTILSSYCDPQSEFAGQKMLGAFGVGDSKAIWKYVTTLYPKTDAEEPDWDELNRLARGGS